MLILKIALGVFVGALGALLAYDAISVYRLQRVAGPLGLKADVVGARFHDRRTLEADQARARAMALPASSAGSIEWTGKPDSRLTVPR